MQLDYFIFYAEANIVCMSILGIILFHDRMYNTRQEKQIWFDRTIIAHFLYFLSDICWAAVLSGILPRLRFLSVLFNFLNYILLGVLAYAWFMYTAACISLRLRNVRRVCILILTPLFLSVLAAVILYAVSPYALINQDGGLTDLYYPMMISAPVLYLAAACVFSLRKARKAELAEERKMLRLIGIYPLSVLAFGLIQTSVLNAPLFCFGCTIMMLFFYIQRMQTLVSVDALTRLNNRGQISRYMGQVRYRENTKAYAVMLDIDNFKKINDTYGHAEGDRALILVSEVLRQAVERIRSAVFIGRYGGDEFTLFLQCGEEDMPPEEVIATIRGMLEERQQGAGLAYDLRISVGYDALRDKDDTMEACLERADQKLYEYKRAAKIGR